MEPPFGFTTGQPWLPQPKQRTRWQPAPPGVLAFNRGGIQCVANLSAAPVGLPPHATILLASGPITGGKLPPTRPYGITGLNLECGRGFSFVV